MTAIIPGQVALKISIWLPEHIILWLTAIVGIMIVFLNMI